jgi:hypothetical protein
VPVVLIRTLCSPDRAQSYACRVTMIFGFLCVNKVAKNFWFCLDSNSFVAKSGNELFHHFIMFLREVHSTEPKEVGFPVIVPQIYSSFQAVGQMVRKSF